MLKKTRVRVLTATIADPGHSFGGQVRQVEHRRREYRGAKATGAEGVGFGEWVFPSPMGRGLEGAVPSPENFWIFVCLGMVHFACILHDT